MGKSIIQFQSGLTQVLTKITAIFSINEDKNILINRK